MYPVSYPFSSLSLACVMNKVTEVFQRDKEQTMFSMPESFDYADDVVLFAHSHQDMQDIASTLDTIGRQVGMNINIKKSDIRKINIEIKKKSSHN